MKVISVLDAEPAVGGGFHQALTAVFQMRDICAGTYDFEVFTSSNGARDLLRQRGVTAARVSFTRRDRAIARLATAGSWRVVRKLTGAMAPLERRLLSAGCDLAYFVTPSGLEAGFQHLNCITTVLDVSHRDSPEFPEVRRGGMLHAREHSLRASLPAAWLTLVDSNESAARLMQYYGASHHRLLIMPYAPSPLLDEAALETTEVMQRHGLAPGYFFYPAQFWPHKNHIRILQALLRLRENGRARTVVFSGGDQGNLRHVQQFVHNYKLGSLVRFTGFVPATHLRGLYDACTAVVMPSYFGPTNIPPLEAWLLRRPVVYSTACADHAGDAALCVDPDDADALAVAMCSVLEPAVREPLVERGVARLAGIEAQRRRAAHDLGEHLRRFAARRELWP
jgi:glycosyltransferase involved in cell wall biosynthesis